MSLAIGSLRGLATTGFAGEHAGRWLVEQRTGRSEPVSSHPMDATRTVVMRHPNRR